MNYLYPIIEPVLNTWDSLTQDKKWKQLTEYPGDWHTKWLSHERYRINDRFREAHERFYEEPTLSNFLWDNKYRFTLLAFLERLYTLRQTQGFLKARFQMPDTDVGALNQIRRYGITGSFRGNLLNLFHTVGVHFHAALWAKDSLVKYLIASTVFEAALYPLDTLRTLYYADVNRQFKNVFDTVTQVVEKNGLQHFYRGVGWKLAYNVVFGVNLWSVASDSNLKYLTFPLWIASYSLLTIKSRIQVSGTPLSFQVGNNDTKLLETMFKREAPKALFSGLLPFLALNIAAAYALPSIISEEKKKEILREIRDLAPERTLTQESKYWS